MLVTIPFLCYPVISRGLCSQAHPLLSRPWVSAHCAPSIWSLPSTFSWLGLTQLRTLPRYCLPQRALPEAAYWGRCPHPDTHNTLDWICLPPVSVFTCSSMTSFQAGLNQKLLYTPSCGPFPFKAGAGCVHWLEQNMPNIFLREVAFGLALRPG